LLVLAQVDHSWIVRGLLRLPTIVAPRHSDNAIILPVLFSKSWPLQGRPAIGGVVRRSRWPVRGRCAPRARRYQPRPPVLSSSQGGIGGRPPVLSSSQGGIGGAVPVEKEAAPHRPGRPVTGEQPPCRPRKLAAVYDPFKTSAHVSSGKRQDRNPNPSGATLAELGRSPTSSASAERALLINVHCYGESTDAVALFDRNGNQLRNNPLR
jgi:hypothetical protein